MQIAAHSDSFCDDLTWCIRVHRQVSKCSALKIFPVIVSTNAALNQLLKLVDTLNICAGHHQHFLDLADSHKGQAFGLLLEKFLKSLAHVVLEI